MNRFTKITSSIGPKCEDRETLTKMIQAGVNVCRLNFSHDTGETQGKKIDLIREVSAELHMPVAIMIDLQGPKHRIGNFATEDKYPLTIGQKFTFDNDPTPGDSTRVQLPDADVMKSLNVGDRILLNDGKIEMTVDSVAPDKIVATVVRGTEIWSRRGFNLPDTEIATSVLTEKDRADLEYALTKDPDWVAISFVQKPEDVAEVRDFIVARTSHPVKIIAKIERPNAVERITEIAAAADGVMIARGDLAVEVPFEEVPAISRHIIRECRKMNKPVIMATQMLGTMVNSEFPTRAEITDVANAAYLRADSTMTSEETTIGINPVNVINTMNKILSYADSDAIANPYDWSRVENIPENDWSRSVASMAYLNRASAIVVFARDTVAATEISCRKPDIPIVAVCRERLIANQLCLSRGVFPIYDEELFGKRDAFNSARKFGVNEGKLVIVDEDKISLRTLD
ncbi:MAG TPA: pyruvate kinase [Candidatus Enterousia avicola]|uniref:Pyruvate kinase n=1 Tax=Candidatus Enterousia avicola TaxID=2840787 RepID=A0A9D1MT08_9PROT|nr:pyruvate kinase [Candidatus Enterousia avicola]